MYCTGKAIGYFEQSDEHIVCSPISIPAACFQLLTIKATYQQMKRLSFQEIKTFASMTALATQLTIMIS